MPIIGSISLTQAGMAVRHKMRSNDGLTSGIPEGQFGSCGRIRASLTLRTGRESAAEILTSC